MKSLNPLILRILMVVYIWLLLLLVCFFKYTYMKEFYNI